MQGVLEAIDPAIQPLGLTLDATTAAPATTG